MAARRPQRRRRRPGRQAAPRHDRRAARREQRRAAILAAALEEFVARGFAAARLDDVARRARIAKGTIYLYFRDKESLFQELVRTMLSPLVGTIEAAPLRDVPIRSVAEICAAAKDASRTLIRGRLALAVERGELSRDALARFPQLLVAPALVAVIWNGLFGRFAPLEIRELMRAHLDLLFGDGSAP